MQNIISSPRAYFSKIALAAFVALITATTPVHAEPMELPGATEVQYYSPEAQQFYAAGVTALNTADYINAYSLLSKAAAIQPQSINLNRIVARLAIYHGRQANSQDSRDFYETAINSFEAILRTVNLTPDARRQITNELKQAQQERDNLAQRDVQREATGTAFIMDWNRKYATRPDRVAGQSPSQIAATSQTQNLVDPMALLRNATPQQQGYGQPGMMMGDPTMMMGTPGMEPGMPGYQPGMGGAPGMAGAPGQV